jgi:hypothetical protein
MAGDTIPRHREIKEPLARHIIRVLSNRTDDGSQEKPT